MPLKIEVSVMQVGASLRIAITKEVAARLDLKKATQYNSGQITVMFV